MDSETDYIAKAIKEYKKQYEYRMEIYNILLIVLSVLILLFAVLCVLLYVTKKKSIARKCFDVESSGKELQYMNDTIQYTSLKVEDDNYTTVELRSKNSDKKSNIILTTENERNFQHQSNCETPIRSNSNDEKTKARIALIKELQRRKRSQSFKKNTNYDSPKSITYENSDQIFHKRVNTKSSKIMKNRKPIPHKRNKPTNKNNTKDEELEILLEKNNSPNENNTTDEKPKLPEKSINLQHIQLKLKKQNEKIIKELQNKLLSQEKIQNEQLMSQEKMQNEQLLFQEKMQDEQLMSQDEMQNEQNLNEIQNEQLLIQDEMQNEQNLNEIQNEQLLIQDEMQNEQNLNEIQNEQLLIQDEMQNEQNLNEIQNKQLLILDEMQNEQLLILDEMQDEQLLILEEMQDEQKRYTLYTLDQIDNQLQELKNEIQELENNVQEVEKRHSQELQN
ncbi:ORF MSV046 hypothetical protein [Melanoplus sanguinipes entomopoxvirus]|uniref:Transmembrane protein n=1 Tax=Melanoplus sanguinipes entomopoxvirus TaxID=83191 RepID=Q9YW46_MSEPV|nr:ORF MSV046 hypothetical protein [Melanoplus sanguinipes entomopoxvirus]AAC97830.1 ORF MSV046 hypothetical protein [Melanoplus sanguinipes entomopoxvirus 'O']